MQLETPRSLPKHYSDIIKELFHTRILKNENYSLRAFARDLNLNPGYLSDLISGKATLSIKKSEEIGRILFLSLEDQKFFSKLVEIANANEKSRSQLENQLYNFDSSHVTVSQEIYASISEWHSLMLLELICLKDFKYDLEWIAQKLLISAEEAEKTVDNLIAKNLLILEDGQLKKQYDYLVLPNGNKSAQAKNFHKLVLENAISAIDEQESETRNFTAAFLHIDTTEIARMSEKIKCFRREFAHEFESENNSNSVYMFSIQLYRADHEIK